MAEPVERCRDCDFAEVKDGGPVGVATINCCITQQIFERPLNSVACLDLKKTAEKEYLPDKGERIKVDGRGLIVAVRKEMAKEERGTTMDIEVKTNTGFITLVVDLKGM